MKTTLAYLDKYIGAALAGSATLLFVACFFMNPAAMRAQGLSPKNVPGLKKITSGGATRSVFTGGVQLLDLHSKVLEVSAPDGTNTAIFPITKKVKVSSIEGNKLKLASLTPGTSVIVRYEQQGGRRVVQQITVVKPGPSAKKQHKHKR